MNPDWDLHYNNVSFSGLNRFFFRIMSLLVLVRIQVKSKIKTSDMKFVGGWDRTLDRRLMIIGLFRWGVDATLMLGRKKQRDWRRCWRVAILTSRASTKKKRVGGQDWGSRKRSEIGGISKNERLEKLELEWNLRNIVGYVERKVPKLGEGWRSLTVARVMFLSTCFLCIRLLNRWLGKWIYI